MGVVWLRCHGDGDLVVEVRFSLMVVFGDAGGLVLSKRKVFFFFLQNKFLLF